MKNPVFLSLNCLGCVRFFDNRIDTQYILSCNIKQKSTMVSLQSTVLSS